MKNLILLLTTTFFFSTTDAQWEIRGGDYICSGASVTYQLYYNGILNTQPVTWRYTTSNSGNQITLSNISYSSVTATYVSSSNGCFNNNINPICCYPPNINLEIRNATSDQLIYIRANIYLGCNFPITGPSTLNIDASTSYFCDATIANQGRQCCGNSADSTSLWVVSDNLIIVNSSFIANSNKVLVKRVGPGQAFVDFYFCDGSAYRKSVQ